MKKHLKQILGDNPTDSQIDELILNDEFYKLELSNHHIKTIEPNTFNGFIKLELVDLHSNLIKTIDEKTFHGLVNLKSLNLTHNRIEVLSVFMD